MEVPDLVTVVGNTVYLVSERILKGAPNYQINLVSYNQDFF